MLAQPGAQLSAEALGEGGQRLQAVVVDGCSGPPPQHGPELVLDVQRDAVVNAVDAAVHPGQDVAALAVGVVDDSVEDRHPPQPRVVGVHQCHLPAGVVVGGEHRKIACRNGIGRTQIHQPGVIRLLHPQLHHSETGRPLPNDCVRHDVPAERLGDQERPVLAAGQRAVGEVPQRLLSGDRLVDALHDAVRQAGLAAEGRVTSRPDSTENHQLAALQRLLRLSGHDPESSPESSPASWSSVRR